MSAQGNFILGPMGLHGNPHDGHTLQAAINQVQSFLPVSLKKIKRVFIDRGYAGSKLDDADIEIYIAGKNERKAGKRLPSPAKRSERFSR